jgi:DNA-binding transcriptional MocR family regulator
MLIDLQLNYPILQGQDELFARLSSEVLADKASSMMELPPYGGDADQRQVAAKWLSRNQYEIPKERVLFCTGGHHAIIVVLLGLGLRGSKIAVDPLTYGNFKTQAQSLGIELIPCAGDNNGMIPSALAQAAANHDLRAVYLMPTVHNPLGIVMPEDRRLEICRVASEHNLFLLDDDAYNFLEANSPPSFAALAPERAFSVWSFSKPFAPVMKFSFLTFPQQYEEKLTSMIRVTSSGAPGIFAEMATRLIQSHELTSVLVRKREEAARRQKLARSILEGLDLQAHETSYHLWIKLPSDKPANRVVEQLRSDGILTSSSDAYRATQEVKVNGLRIALSCVRDVAILHEALQKVRERLMV